MISTGILLFNLSLINNLLGYIGIWLILFEILLGLAASSQISLLTTMSYLSAKGHSANLAGTLFQERIKEEEYSKRQSWFILFAINTLLFFIIVIVSKNF